MKITDKDITECYKYKLRIISEAREGCEASKFISQIENESKFGDYYFYYNGEIYSKDCYLVKDEFLYTKPLTFEFISIEDENNSFYVRIEFLNQISISKDKNQYGEFINITKYKELLNFHNKDELFKIILDGNLKKVIVFMNNIKHK